MDRQQQFDSAKKSWEAGVAALTKCQNEMAALAADRKKAATKKNKQEIERLGNALAAARAKYETLRQETDDLFFAMTEVWI